MADIEKVIKGLEHCKRGSEHIDDNPCNGCPYYELKECQQMMADSLELLKEQEAKNIKSYYGLGGPHGACPSCCTTIPKIIGQETRFCPFCGQAVKWDV